MFIDKPNFKPLDKEYVSVGDLVDFINKNHIMHNVPIWIEFGDGNGTFLRTEANKNYKTNDGITFDNNTLRLNLSPSCLNWVKIDALHPVVLSINNDTVEKEFNNFGCRTTTQANYLVGRELENGDVEYQCDSLGGFSFATYIDGNTCRYRTKDEAYNELKRYDSLKDCSLYQIDEITKIKAIEY